MSRRSLINLVKNRLGINKDIELEGVFGIKRSFLSLVISGNKNMPDRMKDTACAILNISLNELKNIIAQEEESGVTKSGIANTLSAMSRVLGSIEREAGVLPDTVSGGDAEEASNGKIRAGKKRAGNGGGQPFDLVSESGAGEKKRVVRKKNRKALKRGTRAAVVLKAGCVYYPHGTSDHTHRRLVDVVRLKDKPPMVIYSTGSDHNRVCTRNTFLRWLDPSHIDEPQVEA